MTYNYHGSDILNGRKLTHYKTLNNSNPLGSFRSTYDTHILPAYKNPLSSSTTYGTLTKPRLYPSAINSNNISSSINILDVKDQHALTRSKPSYGLRKPVNHHQLQSQPPTYSSSLVGMVGSSSSVPRSGLTTVQPSYLSTGGSNHRLSYQHLLNQIAQITDTLYLSGISAITIDRIRELGITMLVSLITDPVPIRTANLENVVVPIEDTEYANLRCHIDRVIDKMHREQLKGGKVLVHCIAGVSRSASLTLAYLMKYHAMRLRQAYNHVRARRPYIQPNIGFWKQLIEFEKRLFGTGSVRLVPSANDVNSLAPDVAPSALATILFSSTNHHRYGNKNRYGSVGAGGGAYSQF